MSNEPTPAADEPQFPPPAPPPPFAQPQPQQFAPPRFAPPQFPPPPPVSPSRTRLWVALGVVIVLAVAGTITGLLVAGSGGFVLTGEVTVTDVGADGASGDGIQLLGPGNCQGTGGYNDMQAGAEVDVTDAGGATVAVGSLDTGVTEGVGICKFVFRVPNVPSGKHFYGVEVTHRGVIKLSEDAAHQFVTLQLGN